MAEAILAFFLFLIAMTLVAVGSRLAGVVSDLNELASRVDDAERACEALSLRVGSITESQRLSMVLRLEPALLVIQPEDFEPNREHLKAELLRVFRESSELYRTEGSKKTWAHVILDNSGFLVFVDVVSGASIQVALARLLTNGDETTIERFLVELVDRM